MEQFFKKNKNETKGQPAPEQGPREAPPIPGGISAMLDKLPITKPSKLQATLDKAVADGLLSVSVEPDEPYIDGK